MSCSADNILSQGSCAPSTCGPVVPGFGVCLAALVTVAKPNESTTITNSSTVLPWWIILLIVLGGLTVIGIMIYLWRRKEQKRRKAQTARFANDLGQKEVDLKLRELPREVAFPPLPRAENLNRREGENDFEREEEVRRFNDVPLTPTQRELQPRWSVSSYGSSTLHQPSPPRKLTKQYTGASDVSGYSHSSVHAPPSQAKSVTWGDLNPFGKM